MLCGALLTVRRMVKRLPPKAPTFRTSSLDCFKAVWPAKADCWIAEVAIFVGNFLRGAEGWFWTRMIVVKMEVILEMERYSGLGLLHVSSILLVLLLKPRFSCR